MNAVVREMTMDDYDDVIALWLSDHGVGLGDAAYLGRNPGMYAVARLGRKLVGAVLCGHDGLPGYTTHLAVAESHGRGGVGRQLAGQCTDRIREHGIDKCHILVFPDNDEALAYWRATGWAERRDLRLLSKLAVQEERD